MKILTSIATVCCLTILSGCNNVDSAHRDDRNKTPGERAGEAAYLAKKDAKEAADKLSRDLKSFREDARQGYQEEKQKDRDHPPPPPPQ